MESPFRPLTLRTRMLQAPETISCPVVKYSTVPSASHDYQAPRSRSANLKTELGSVASSPTPRGSSLPMPRVGGRPDMGVDFALTLRPAFRLFQFFR